MGENLGSPGDKTPRGINTHFPLMWNSALIQWWWIMTLGSLGSTSHRAKIKTAGLKLWKMHLAWTSGIWTKVIEHLDMWAWICTEPVWSLRFAVWLELLHLHVCMDRYCERADVFFPSAFLKAKRLLMWFNLIYCCTFKAETSSLNRMLAGVHFCSEQLSRLMFLLQRV